MTSEGEVKQHKPYNIGCNSYDVAVIGAGAAGMTAAAFSAYSGASVLVLERMDRPGKKIYATGNGRCNFTNVELSADFYRGTDRNFVRRSLDRMGLKETIDYFRSIGIYPMERRGYFYPNSGQAASVVKALQLELERLKVHVKCNTCVENVKADENGFFLTAGNGEKYRAKKLIIATGGCASPKLGSDGSGYRLAKQLGHTIVEPLPALVPLIAAGKYMKTIAGVRVEAEVRLYISSSRYRSSEQPPARQQNRFCVASSQGEIVFTDYGISGIPVMQLSRFASEALSGEKNVELEIDLFPDVSENELCEEVGFRLDAFGERTVEEAMTGLLNEKLNFCILQRLHYPVTDIVSEVFSDRARAKETVETAHHMIQKADFAKAFSRECKSFRMIIVGTKGMDMAQVTAGGIATAEVDAGTMESKLVNGLYFCGELLDIDGTCGGYNLQWAWSSGASAGQEASGEGAIEEDRRASASGQMHQREEKRQASGQHRRKKKMRQEPELRHGR